MSLVVYLFLGIPIFLGAILFLGASIPQVMFGNKGEIVFPGDDRIKEVIHPLLIHIWGDHMVLIV